MRRPVVGAGLGVLAFVLAVAFWPTRRSGPEPIAYGRDACAHCRMHLSQPGFAGEMRDHAGVLTKYDDVGCLLGAMLATHREIPEAWVEDHDTAELVPLLGAHLVRGDRGATPMGAGIVAFRDEASARAFAHARGGELVRLEDLIHDPERLARGEGKEAAR